MQKKLMMIVILLLALSNRMAADDQVDQLTISDFSIFTEQTKDVSIALTNADAYSGFQFDLELPEGVTVSAYSANSARITTAAELSMQQQTGGTYRFVFLSQSATPLSGNSGDAIINLTLQAAATVAVGEKTGYFKNIKLSKIDGTGPTYTSQSFTFTVRGNEPYAVLSDENIKLTFYYDKQKDTRTGVVELSDLATLDNKDVITNVVFDNSFVNYTSLTSTAGWFSQCTNLTSITGIANLKTDNVTDMSQMFMNCQNLASLNVSYFNTGNVTNMASMFNSCSSLTDLDLSSFETNKVTDMSLMFSGCYGLTSLDLSTFNTSNLVYVNYMFQGSNHLSYIYVGSSWTTSNIAEGYGVGLFDGCIDLIGGVGTVYNESYTDYAYAHIDGGAENPGYFTDVVYISSLNEPYAILSDDNSKLTLYYDKRKVARQGLDLSPIGWESNKESITSVVFDRSFANYVQLTSTYEWFKGCKKLSSIEGLSNLNTESVTWMEDMFYECQALTTLDLSSFKTYRVINMMNMFYGCSNLKNLNISSFETDDVKYMDGLFYGCSSLESIDVSGFNTSKVTTMMSMFRDCSKLKSIDISNFGSDKLINICDMFRGCSSLISIGLSNLKTNNVWDTSGLFQDCSSLTTLDLSVINTSSVTNMTSMFSGCTSLTTL
ncbi:BspA family leucine-rich repeat surface protein, partial [Xylanibacter ruminicola]